MEAKLDQILTQNEEIKTLLTAVLDRLPKKMPYERINNPYIFNVVGMKYHDPIHIFSELDEIMLEQNRSAIKVFVNGAFVAHVSGKNSRTLLMIMRNGSNYQIKFLRNTPNATKFSITF